MSRIGKQPIDIPEGVEVKIKDNLVSAKGPKGELSQTIHPFVNVEMKDKQISVFVLNPDDKFQRSLWGLTQRLVSNLIFGVSQGYEKKLEFNGVGYRAEVKGKELVLNLGFSHPINYQIPEKINIIVNKKIIIVSGIDKQLIGETAAQIRRFRPPEPYKGKGIKYVDEVIRRKVGKKTAATTA
ncbi:MAG: 50S ribosomal protein L6 [Candidatus Aenigmarchaeota archaeon]|nr:50S ribosomal protein L6 [Candidatus Aenigmarchaeota archaeon]